MVFYLVYLVFLVLLVFLFFLQTSTDDHQVLIVFNQAFLYFPHSIYLFFCCIYFCKCYKIYYKYNQHGLKRLILFFLLAIFRSLRLFKLLNILWYSFIGLNIESSGNFLTSSIFLSFTKLYFVFYVNTSPLVFFFYFKKIY